MTSCWNPSMTSGGMTSVQGTLVNWAVTLRFRRIGLAAIARIAGAVVVRVPVLLAFAHQQAIAVAAVDDWFNPRLESGCSEAVQNPPRPRGDVAAPVVASFEFQAPLEA